MVALLSPATPKSARFRRIARRSLPAPRTLVINRISDLHRQLIDAKSDSETVKAAKHSLLRLLADPATLPVITTGAMAGSIVPKNNAERPSAAGEENCEICGRTLSPANRSRTAKTTTQRVANRSIRNVAHDRLDRRRSTRGRGIQ